MFQLCFSGRSGRAWIHAKAAILFAWPRGVLDRDYGRLFTFRHVVWLSSIFSRGRANHDPARGECVACFSRRMAIKKKVVPLTLTLTLTSDNLFDSFDLRGCESMDAVPVPWCLGYRSNDRRERIKICITATLVALPASVRMRFLWCAW